MAIVMRVAFVNMILSAIHLKTSKAVSRIRDLSSPQIYSKTLVQNDGEWIIKTVLKENGPAVWIKDGEEIFNISEIPNTIFTTGSKIVLPVDGRPNLSLKLQVNRPNTYTYNKQWNLNILCPQPNDAGVYTLRAQINQTYWQTLNFTLTVTSDPGTLCPYITSNQRRYGTFPKGCLFNLTCNNPDRTGVTIKWLKRGRATGGSHSLCDSRNPSQFTAASQHDGKPIIKVPLTDLSEWKCQAIKNGLTKTSSCWTWDWKRDTIVNQPVLEEAPSIDAVDSTSGQQTQLNSGASVSLLTNVSLSCNHCSKSQVASWTKNAGALATQTNWFWLLQVNNESDVGNFSCKIKYPGTTTFGKVSDTFQLLFKDEPPPDLPVNQSKCKPPGEPVGSLSPLGVAIALLVVVVVGTMVVLRFFICICCCSNTQRAEDTGKRRSTKGNDQSTVGTEEPEEEEADKDSFKEIPLITEEMKKHYDEWRAQPPKERSLSVPSTRGSSLTSTEIGYYVTSRYS